MCCILKVIRGGYQNQRQVNVDPLWPKCFQFGGHDSVKHQQGNKWNLPHVSVGCLHYSHFLGLSGNLHVQATSSSPRVYTEGHLLHRCTTNMSFGDNLLCFKPYRNQTQNSTKSVPGIVLHHPMPGRKQNSKIRKGSPAIIFTKYI